MYSRRFCVNHQVASELKITMGRALHADGGQVDWSGQTYGSQTSRDLGDLEELFFKRCIGGSRPISQGGLWCRTTLRKSQGRDWG